MHILARPGNYFKPTDFRAKKSKNLTMLKTYTSNKNPEKLCNKRLSVTILYNCKIDYNKHGYMQ